MYITLLHILLLYALLHTIFLNSPKRKIIFNIILINKNHKILNLIIYKEII